jgi:CHAD domain-containing protein
MSYALKPGEKLAHGIRRIEKRQVGRIIDELGKPRPERQRSTVHEARKDLKKARAALRLIREYLDAKDYRKENRNLRKVGRALARRRDAEVLLKTVDKLRADRHNRRTKEILTKLRQVLLERNKKFFRQPPITPKVKAKLKSARGQIKSWHLGSLKWPDLSCGNQRTYQQGRKAFHEAERARTPENLHEWRKRVKDMWYQLRVLQPARSKAIKRRAREMKQLSKYLGDDHDLTMFKQAVKTAKFAKPQTKLLDELADSQREKLEQAAFELGHRLYAEKPAAFGRLIKHYGKKWNSH